MASPPGESIPPAPALSANGLAKRFGDREALRGVSFEVSAGETVALIGPNGAGKTTLLSILAGVQAPDSGEVHGTGVGWVPQQAALYRRLTVSENLMLFARLQAQAGLGSKSPEARVARMLELTGLAGRSDDRVGTLSGGNQQRVNIAIGLMAEPSVLLLDEPGVGLDPAQRARLWEFVLGQVETGTAAVFSTHDIAEADRYADRVVVLADAEAIFSGTVEELKLTAGTGPGNLPGAPHPGSLEAAFLTLLEGAGS